MTSEITMAATIHRAGILLIAAICAPLCVAAPVQAQEAVRVDILSLYGSIPRPPGAVEEAYGRAHCEVRQGCSAEEHYAPTEKSLGELNMKLQQLSAALQQAPSHPLANVDPEELERKLAAMSQAEQIRFAQQLANAEMAGAETVVESPAVQAVMREAAAVREAIGRDAIARGGESTFQPDALAAALREELGRIDVEVAAKRAAVPQPDDQGPSAAIIAYERQISAIEQDGMRQRLDAQAEYHRAVADAWHRHLAATRDRFARLQSLLPGIRYGQAARGNTARLDIVNVQLLMLGVANDLLLASRRATESGAQMWLAKLQFDEVWGR